MTVAARHGVIQPPVRRTAENLDSIRFGVCLERAAQLAHMVNRDDVILLAKHAEHRAAHLGQEFFKRDGIARIFLPFAILRGTVPAERGLQRAVGCQQHRKTPRLADPHGGDTREIGLWDSGQRGNGILHPRKPLGIGHVATGLARMQSRLIRMLMKIIAGDADIAIARMATGEVARMLDEAIPLMQQHDNRHLFGRLRHGEKGWHPARTGDRLFGNGHARTPLISSPQQDRTCRSGSTRGWRTAVP